MRDIRTDKPPSFQNRFNRWQKFPACICLENVSLCTIAQCCAYDIWISLLSHEEYRSIWNECGDSFGSFDTVQSRQPNVEQNQIWLQFLGLLNCLQSVGGLINDLPLRPRLQGRTNEAPKRLEVIDHESADYG